MLDFFPKTEKYLMNLNLDAADPLDKKASELLKDPQSYERASQALRRRFSRGASDVEGIDRVQRRTKIKREKEGGKFRYFVEGENGNWFEPEDRLWVVAMYALWQDVRSA